MFCWQIVYPSGRRVVNELGGMTQGESVFSKCESILDIFLGILVFNIMFTC
jgi:hypothetical protein